MTTQRLLLSLVGALMMLVTWATWPNWAQSQTSFHSTPTPMRLERAPSAGAQNELGMSSENASQVNDKMLALIRHSSALTASLVATIPVGASPSGIGVNAVTNRIYVSNRDSNTVSVIDGATHQIMATIAVGNRPSLQVGINPDTNRIYVPNNWGSSLSVIDGATNTVITTITGLATSPEGVGVHPGRNLIYVTHSGDQLSVIDGVTNLTSTVINTGYWNHFVAVNPDTDRAYVSRSDPDLVAVIDLTTDQKTSDIMGGGHPAANPVTNRVYLAWYRDPVIGVVDGATNNMTALINVESIPGLIAVNPVNERVYVTLPGSNAVTIINGATNTVVGTVGVGSHPMSIAVNPTTGLIYVVNENDNTVSVIQDDKDGDGLFDIWETRGLTVPVGNDSVFVDLPAMGANPDRKDIFVEIDYMVEQGICLPLLGCYFGHTHQPKPEAIARIVQAFANAPVSNPDGSVGITLHVDHGPDSVMNPASGERWGNRSPLVST